MCQYPFRQGVAAMVLLLSICAVAGAQEFRGSLSGTVTDPAGAAVPGATVELKNVETNVAATATTNGEGGADAFYIAAILSHGDVNASQIYTIATNAGLRRAMEALTQPPKQIDAIVPTQEERRPLAAAVNS